MTKLFITILLAILVNLSGCASPPKPVDGMPLKYLSSLDQGQLFAGTEDGRQVAYVKNGLHIIDVESGAELEITSQAPQRVVWSPDGAILAATFRNHDYETRLVQYDREGGQVHEAMLPVAVSHLVWSLRGDLLATGYKLQVYSFGGNLQQSLFRVNGSEVNEISLSDTTLKPGTVKIVESVLSDVQPVVFSRYGDQVTYTRQHDPPEFLPYLNIVSMHWQAGSSKTLLELPLQKVQLNKGKYEDTVEVVLASNKQVLDVWPKAGEPSSPYLFVDGRLYERDTLLIDWGRDTKIQLLSDGLFLLASDSRLYLGSGLHSARREVYSEKKWTLRRWRALKLISPEEYQDLLVKEE